MSDWTQQDLDAVAAGRKAWEDGEPMPPMPEGDVMSKAALFWMGFQDARCRDFFRRRGMALYPDAVEPRPPARDA